MADPVNNTVLQGQLDTIKTNIDAFFILTMACIIFFMQCGFAFLEAGSVRSKNTTNILLKNVLDSFVSGLAYWAIGYPLAFGGGNFFLGHKYWFSAGLPSEQYHMWFFHFVFAATAATIVSGALAERCDFIAYFVYSFMITGFVYPVVVHWAWAPEGWLLKGDGNIGYQDFAGSGVVHLLGGTAALVGAVFLGPRKGRFDELSKEVRDIPGHSVPLMSLGGFILFFGFFAFNGGSQASISQSGDAEAVSLAIVNTVIAGTFAAFAAMFGQKIGSIVCGKAAAAQSKWSLLVTINGALTGMVAVCSGCNVFYPWGACIVGLVAGFAFLAWSWLLIVLKVDDPLSAVAVHGGGGMWGIIATPILQRHKGIVFTGSRDSFLALGWNVAGMAAIIAWSGTISIIMFGILKAIKILRVDPEIEKNGLDIPKHGEPAYPPEAWGDGWSTYHVDETMKIVRRMSRQMGLQRVADNTYVIYENGYEKHASSTEAGAEDPVVSARKSDSEYEKKLKQQNQLTAITTIPDSILEKACDELKRDLPRTNPHVGYGSSELNRMQMYRNQHMRAEPVYEEDEENEYTGQNSVGTVAYNVDHENNHAHIENTQL